MTTKVLFLVSFCVILLLACTKAKTEINPFTDLTCDGDAFFANEIEPIIQQNCSTSGCHDATAIAGYEFSTYQSIANNADRIYKTLKHEANVVAMPYNLPKLQDSLINKFGCWMAQGKPNN